MAFNTNQQSTSIAFEAEPSSDNQFSCRLCKAEFTDRGSYREHFKSSWHVENKKREIGGRRPLNQSEYHQMRLSKKGSEIGNDDDSDDLQARANFRGHCSTCDREFRSEKSFRSHLRTCGAQLESLVVEKSESKPREEVSDETDSIASGSSDEAEPLFDETICLFCLCESPNMKLNMAHMTKEHGFSIHSPEKITDLDAYLYWLYLDINEFFACICCDASRKSAEGIRHHMMAKGHCRTTIEAEAEFYDDNLETESMSKISDQASKLTMDEDTIILPSGKEISNRLAPKVARKTRTHSPSQKEKAAITESETIEESQSAKNRDMRMTIRASDSMALAGLSSVEVRSLRKKEVKMLSAERRARTEYLHAVQKVGNRQKNFKPDVPGRLNG